MVLKAALMKMKMTKMQFICSANTYQEFQRLPLTLSEIQLEKKINKEWDSGILSSRLNTGWLCMVQPEAER